MARTRTLAGLSIGIGLLVPLLAAEVILRFLPVQSGLQALPVNDRNPILRFSPHREFIFSKGWDFELINKGRTNNYGFVSDLDYDSTAHSPLLAVIGDSYVEAKMVPFSQTLQGRLSRCVGSWGRVYSVGVSGAPLSAYLAEARYARSVFRPDGLVVVIVGNDFDESLAQYGTRRGSYSFRKEANRLVLERIDYTPGLMHRIGRRSALVRYLMLNLGGASPRPKRILQRVEPEYIGNTAAAYTSERMLDSRAAVDEFLSSLPAYAGLAPERIVLIMDAMRPSMYSEEGLQAASGSFFDLMRRYLIDQGRAGGFEVVDMQPRFMRRYSRTGVRFEFPSDLHWNARGHEEAAEAVAFTKTFRQLFPGSCLDLAQEGELVARP